MNSIKQKGFSIVELMVAMAIGLFLLLGLVALFTNSSVLNRAQSGLAQLQENGRYAIARIKNDIEQAGQMHCASMTMPNDIISDWDQGYQSSVWYAHRNFSFGANGLPDVGNITLDTIGGGDNDQLGDSPVPAAGIADYYPIDRRFLIQGHDCVAGTCEPSEGNGATQGADWSTNFRTAGVTDGSRAASTDILTVRYLSGGYPITGWTGNTFTIDGEAGLSGPALVSDCSNSYIDNASWSATNVTLSNTPPGFDVISNTRAFNLNTDLQTVSYFVGVDADPADSSRMISSLYRSVNGNTQQLVEGVERLDFFYLAQLQTGHVVRMTAEEVQSMSGGDGNQPTGIPGPNGCIAPPRAALLNGLQVANDEGCLWRSIYAVEVNMLLNTVDDSTTENDATYIYSPDGDARQNPSGGLASGLDSGRMYRREFSAVIPIRSYTL